MARNKNPKVTNINKYRSKFHINIEMVIFVFIFIYICTCIVLYFKDNHITGYEVQEGSLSVNTIYRGIILREEQVKSTDTAGYINYYAREDSRVAVGDLVYTIDETGRLADYVSGDELGANSLSDADLSELKNDISNYNHTFSATNFSSIYDFKYSVMGTVLKIANNSLVDSIASLGGAEGSIAMSYADNTGIVMYWTDGYELLTTDQITKDVFDSNNYERSQIIASELVAQGDPTYKICTNENWSIVIPVEESMATDLQEAEYVKVRFLKNQNESWGQVVTFTGTDGETYAQLSFSNSMISFAGERFLEVELILNDEVGLKIPNTSIVNKEFFLVPENYVTQGDKKNTYEVLRETVLEDGTLSTEKVEVGVYSLIEGEYYLDNTVLRSGDRLYGQDTMDTYVLSKRATLIGVYNMNKGYADFRQIDILYQNEEYSIVKSNTEYGLNVYDYIVLNAKSVKEDQFIYE